MLSILAINLKYLRGMRASAFARGNNGGAPRLTIGIGKRRREFRSGPESNPFLNECWAMNAGPVRFRAQNCSAISTKGKTKRTNKALHEEFCRNFFALGGVIRLKPPFV